MVAVASLKFFFIFFSSFMATNGQNSLPKVTNVHIFQYTPIPSNPTKRNALIIWNEIESATQYVIRIVDYSSGMDLELSQPVLDTRASYSVLQRERPNEENASMIVPQLPLVVGKTYGVEVTAKYGPTNDKTSGLPSDRVNFTLTYTDMNYPMQILSLEPEVVRYYGHHTEINQNLRIGPNSGPIVVDAIHRRAYWYDQNMNHVATQSLSIGGAYKVLFHIHTGQLLGSLTYDWIAKVLYITYISQSFGSLTLFKRQIYDIEDEREVFAEPFLEVSPGAKIHSEINPIGGYIYYSITDGDNTEIYMLDLRLSDTRGLAPVRIGVSVTSALALNPANFNLFVSEKNTGNILQCSFDLSYCPVFINRSALEANSKNSISGLPARIITYGGQFIYWTSASNNVSGIFAVDVSNTSTMTVLNSNAIPNFLSSLSPDQQPIPDVECLSPRIISVGSKQMLSLNFKTSRTIQLVWQNPPPPDFQSPCGLGLFSLAPLIFTIKIEIQQRVIRTEMTRKRRHLFTGLEANMTYDIFLTALNEYSLTYGQPPFNAHIRVRTREEAYCDKPSRTFRIHYGEEEQSLRLSFYNSALLRTAARSGECVNVTLEHESQTIFVQERVTVHLNCEVLKLNESTVIEWFSEPLDDFNGEVLDRRELVENSMEVVLENDVLILPETNTYKGARSNRFTCTATTNDNHESRHITVFFVGEKPLLPETGGCIMESGTMRCTLGNQLTRLTLNSNLMSISLECPIINSDRTNRSISMVNPDPYYTWTKLDRDIVVNGSFTNLLNLVYPELDTSTVPVIPLQANKMIVLLRPNNTSSRLYNTRCFQHEYSINLEDTYYHLATGEWKCSVRNIYGESHGSVIISEPDLCTTQNTCGEYPCQTIAKRACCDCPRNSDYLSLEFGKHCSRITCPLNHGIQQNIKVSLNKKGEIIGTYSCSEGYFLIGKSNRTCQQSLETWMGQMPRCEKATCDNSSKSFKILYGEEERSLQLNYYNGSLLRIAAKSGECVNVIVEHQTQTVLVQDRVKVYMNCDQLKLIKDTEIQWFRQPLDEIDGTVRGRSEVVENNMEFFVKNGLLVLLKTDFRKRERSNRFTCRATTYGIVQSRQTTVFIVGEKPLVPKTGGCIEVNETMRCTLGNQLTRLTLNSNLTSISLECPVSNSDRTHRSISMVSPLPYYTWTKHDSDIIVNGSFTTLLDHVYPELDRSTMPVTFSKANKITLLLRPAHDSLQLYNTQCLHHKFSATLEDTYYHLATGEWKCSVRNVYGESHGRIIISEPDLCSTKKTCGGFMCQTIAKRTCCNCPRNSNYVSHQLGNQCTRINCPPPVTENHQNVEVSLNQDNEVIASFTCEDGYFRLGIPYRTCVQSIPLWSGDMPSCIGRAAPKQTAHYSKIIIFAVLVLDCKI